jgi:RHS repeat-associated protein
VLTTTYPADTAENVAYTYDQTGTGFSFGIGRLTSLTDMAGSLTRAYDERGNLLTEIRTSGTTTLTTAYTYDAASRVLTVTYPDSSLLTYTRDAMGRITAVSDKPSGAGSATTVASGVTYEPFGPWAGFTYGNSITETPTWDLDYRLTKLTDIGTATAQNISYTYYTSDQPESYVDNLTSSNTINPITIHPLAWAYAWANTGHNGSTSIDDNGNRTSQTGATTATWTLNSGTDQYATMVTGGTTTTISTNANGNITGFSPAFGTAGVTTLAYNNGNRLSSVSGSSGTLGAYVYDAFGQRFSKAVGSTTTLYQYSGGALIAETTGGVETNYIYLNGRPLAMLSGTTFTYLHDDKLGRPQVATNASQTVLWKASYLPFGETLATSGTAAVNLRFAGQYYDAETGFSHNGFRDYVPTWGRYLEADPIGIYDNSGIVNSGMNPYNYVGADPMRSIDPLGLWCVRGNFGTTCPKDNIRKLINTLQNPASWENCAGGDAGGTGGAGGAIGPTSCQGGLNPGSIALMQLMSYEFWVRSVLISANAGTFLEEGTTVLSGHGWWDPSNGLTVVPDGTSITTYAGLGNAITNDFGNAIEDGANLGPFSNQMEGAQTYLSGSFVPNLTLGPLESNYFITGSPVTVNAPQTLDQLLAPNMGNVKWAACLRIKSC